MKDVLLAARRPAWTAEMMAEKTVAWTVVATAGKSVERSAASRAS